jgi:thiol-disulfide isomerase/thioredoxin
MRKRGIRVRIGAAAVLLVLVAAALASCGERPAEAVGDDEIKITYASDETAPPPRRVLLEGTDTRRLQLETISGKKAPALQLDDWINSEGITLEDLEGKVVLLDFFGAWCPPCRKLTPFLIDLHERYSGQGLAIIGIHTQRAAERGPAYVSKTRIPYPVGFDTEGRTVKAYRVNGFPDIYMVDRSGNLRYADIRTNPSENIVTAVEELLAE